MYIRVCVQILCIVAANALYLKLVAAQENPHDFDMYRTSSVAAIQIPRLSTGDMLGTDMDGSLYDYDVDEDMVDYEDEDFGDSGAGTKTGGGGLDTSEVMNTTRRR